MQQLNWSKDDRRQLTSFCAGAILTVVESARRGIGSDFQLFQSVPTILEVRTNGENHVVLTSPQSGALRWWPTIWSLSNRPPPFSGLALTSTSRSSSHQSTKLDQTPQDSIFEKTIKCCLKFSLTRTESHLFCVHKKKESLIKQLYNACQSPFLLNPKLFPWWLFEASGCTKVVSSAVVLGSYY